MKPKKALTVLTGQTLMTRMIMVFAIVVFTQVVSAQTTETNLYQKALNTYLEENERKYAKIITERNFRKVIVIKNDFITTSLPTKIGEYEIEYLDLSEMALRLSSKSKQKELLVAEIRPIKNNGNDLIVSIGEYQARYEKKQVFLGLSSGIKIIFKFNCGTENFVVEKFEFFGV